MVCPSGDKICYIYRSFQEQCSEIPLECICLSRNSPGCKSVISTENPYCRTVRCEIKPAGNDIVLYSAMGSSIILLLVLLSVIILLIKKNYGLQWRSPYFYRRTTRVYSPEIIHENSAPPFHTNAAGQSTMLASVSRSRSTTSTFTGSSPSRSGPGATISNNHIDTQTANAIARNPPTDFSWTFSYNKPTRQYSFNYDITDEVANNVS